VSTTNSNDHTQYQLTINGTITVLDTFAYPDLTDDQAIAIGQAAAAAIGASMASLSKVVYTGDTTTYQTDLTATTPVFA
jgi:hypothetical protein